MKIKNLASLALEEVMSCFLLAFEGYFVKLPEDLHYWKERFAATRVNWELSFGMFDDERLVGFVIHGIDFHNGQLTAYNTGTGVLVGYRGLAVVDKLYAHAIPVLKAEGIEKCLLEVICENERAIKVYKRIGFQTTRKLSSFTGSLPEIPSEKRLQKCHFSEVMGSGLYNEGLYAWENSARRVKLMEDRVQTWCLGDLASPEAYLVMDTSGNILQLFSKSGNYLELLTAAGRVVKEVKLKNLNAARKELIDTLQKCHFSNPVNQVEMEMNISSR
jgi:ribosomal protein S18 acetylase RimI-like enzyme